MHWALMPFRRYFEKDGRSGRREFWAFSLLNFAVTVLLWGAAIAVSPGTSTYEDVVGFQYSFNSQIDQSPVGMVFAGLFLLYAIAALIPSIMVSVRRLHDRGATGWWLVAFPLFFLVPLFGLLTPFAFMLVMALPGQEGRNRYGPDPRNPYEEDVFA